MTSGFEVGKFLHFLAAIQQVVVGDALSRTTFAIMPPVVTISGIIMVAKPGA